MSRELTIAWAKHNCPDPRVARDVSLRLDEAQGRHVYFMVGRNITRAKVAYLVISQRREVFAFELTPAQEKNFSSQPDALGALIQAKHDEVEADAPDEPLFTISNIVIDHAEALPGRETLTGRIEYESSKPIVDEFVVRLMYQMPGGAMISHFHHTGGPLSGEGMVRFRMTPLLSDRVPKLPKTLPVFVSLCHAVTGVVTQVPISNTCAALIDLA